MVVIGGLDIEVASERVTLRPDRTLFWPAMRTLVVADVHVGKTESLRSRGLLLPDGVLDDDLARLTRAITETGSTRLIIVGDMVHDTAGLTAAVRERVVAWRRANDCRVDLILGNHDRRVRELPAAWALEVHPQVLLEPPFAFAHDARDPRAFTWSGHRHPVIALSDGVDRLRVPCFHVGVWQGVLPAFSALTGGMPPARSAGDRLYGIAGKHVFRVAER